MYQDFSGCSARIVQVVISASNGANLSRLGDSIAVGEKCSNNP